jgi:hypothetical protein
MCVFLASKAVTALVGTAALLGEELCIGDRALVEVSNIGAECHVVCTEGHIANRRRRSKQEF